MGYSCSKYFSRCIRKKYGVLAKELLDEQRFEMVSQSLKVHPKEEIYYGLARKLGFADHNGLYKFVKGHTGLSLTELQRRVNKFSIQKFYNKFKQP